MIINPSKTKCNFLLVDLRLLLEISNEAYFNFRPHRNVKTKAILNFDSKLYNSQGDEFIMDFKKICEPYKKEAYDLFNKMMFEIQSNTVRYIFRAKFGIQFVSDDGVEVIEN